VKPDVEVVPVILLTKSLLLVLAISVILVGTPVNRFVVVNVLKEGTLISTYPIALKVLTNTVQVLKYNPLVGDGVNEVVGV
jgi:hypothetical protein